MSVSPSGGGGRLPAVNHAGDVSSLSWHPEHGPRSTRLAVLGPQSLLYCRLWADTRLTSAPTDADPHGDQAQKQEDKPVEESVPQVGR